MAAGRGRGSEPSPRWGHFSAAVGDQLYVWGGRTKDFSKEKNVLASSIHCFHPVLESFSDHQCSGPPPPTLYNGASASTGNHLYLYGGYDGSDYQNCFYQLDTQSLKWQQLSSAGPMKKFGCRMIAYGRKLLLLGGHGIPSHPSQSDFVKDSKHTDGRGWTNELHSFDLEEGECDVLPLTVCSCCACPLDETFSSATLLEKNVWMVCLCVCLLPLRDMVLLSC